MKYWQVFIDLYRHHTNNSMRGHKSDSIQKCEKTEVCGTSDEENGYNVNCSMKDCIGVMVKMDTYVY